MNISSPAGDPIKIIRKLRLSDAKTSRCASRVRSRCVNRPKLAESDASREKSLSLRDRAHVFGFHLRTIFDIFSDCARTRLRFARGLGATLANWLPATTFPRVHREFVLTCSRWQFSSNRLDYVPHLSVFVLSRCVGSLARTRSRDSRLHPRLFDLTSRPLARFNLADCKRNVSRRGGESRVEQREREREPVGETTTTTTTTRRSFWSYRKEPRVGIVFVGDRGFHVEYAAPWLTLPIEMNRSTFAAVSVNNAPACLRWLLTAIPRSCSIAANHTRLPRIRQEEIKTSRD